MLDSLIEKINSASIDFIDSIANKLGLSSILTSVGVTIAQDGTSTVWVFTDYVLLISAIGGILFIIEKIIVIYIRIRQAARIKRAEHKSRGLPK